MLDIKNAMVLAVFIFLKHIMACVRDWQIQNIFYREESIPCTNFRVSLTSFACTLSEQS